MKGKYSRTDPCDFKAGQRFVVEGAEDWVEIFRVEENAIPMPGFEGHFELQTKCIGYKGNLQKKRYEIGSYVVFNNVQSDLTYWNWH